MSPAADPHALLPAFVGGYWGQSAGAAVRDAGGGAEALAEARGALALAAGRGNAPAAVRAFNPSEDEHGYRSPGSALETNTPDLPFLVDSVSVEIASRGIGIMRVVHPIVSIARDDDGQIVSLGDEENGARESIMHFELDRRLDPQELADLETGVRDVLASVALVVDDFAQMVERVARLKQVAAQGASIRGTIEDDPQEIQAFLQWLSDDNLVFLGYREEANTDNDPAPLAGSELGLLRGRDSGGIGIEAELNIGSVGEDHRLLRVMRSHALSPVHRREPMLTVLVRRIGEDGEPDGVCRLVGLMTSRAAAEPASRTPLLRSKLEHIVTVEKLVHGSHDYKAAVALFDHFPKGELLASPVSDLRHEIATLIGTPPGEVRVVGRMASHHHAASLVALLPRARVTGELRSKVRAIIAEAYKTTTVEINESLGEGDRALLHIRARSEDVLPDVDVARIEQQIREQSRTWADRVRDRLEESKGPEAGRVLAARWAEHMPDSYRAAVEPEAGALDIVALDRLMSERAQLHVGFQSGQHTDGRDVTRVLLYKCGPKIELSDAAPLLEAHGLRVIDENPTHVADQRDEVWIQAFTVVGPDGQPVAIDTVAHRLAASIEAAWAGRTELDSLGRLVLVAGLRWDQVQILRALQRYRQRIGSRYSEEFRNDVFVAQPEITAALVSYFETRFALSDGDGPDERQLHDGILKMLDAVELLDHDRVLRNHIALVNAIVRTNVCAPEHDVMAFKIRSADVPGMPGPAPLFEIFVYDPELEGIHIRGGMIARGGLRWSDRMDYRTEVFGLMRAQMTKNAVIVPAGAKGGFYIKHPPSDQGELREAVKASYIRYIEALLDVTDNLDPAGAVVHPEGVRVRDGEDSYFVVAADKGTATFSDTANEIAVRRGFWLGDAFASGGSVGYDHKKLGITARGAWESVKRHFRELGIDPEADPVTAVGIGDMSGDVFGNGMLLSTSLRLIAAYDHRHIFIDPAGGRESAERSWQERKRLFDLPGSSWADYDESLISAGGGVFPRTLKSVTLTDEIRAALGTEQAELTPNELIKVILSAPVDLLWNGGIGTVVKASTQTDADAADRASDGIRIDATDLRCRVVGEGGNLGFTHRARIEAAQNGVRIFADFIDNSGGVDSSDHEVNLKILLDLAVRRELMTVDERNQLLADVTEDVVQHVLYNSFLQAQILSQEVPLSKGRMFAYEDLMDELEQSGIASRSGESLPTDDQMADRRRAGEGMERPELAVLVAGAKRMLTEQLLASELPADPAFEADLAGYFPPAVVERVGVLLGEHPLRRELIATLVANDVVNSMGPTFACDMSRELGVDGATVARCYRIARAVTSAEKHWQLVEECRDAGPDAIGEVMGGVDALVAAVTRWYINSSSQSDIGSAIAAAAPVFDELASAMYGLRGESWRADYDKQRSRMESRGIPAEMAAAHAARPALYHGADIASVVQKTGQPVTKVARAFFAVGERLDLERLERHVLALPGASSIHRWAQQALIDDLLWARRTISAKALARHDGDADAAVDAYIAENSGRHARLTVISRALSSESAADAAALALAIRHVRALAG